MKYAILEAGGKQYVAREGETIEVDRMPLEVGKSVTFDEVLLAVDDGKVLVGSPLVEGATVTGKVVEQLRGPKIIVFKYKPKQRYRKKQGHRQAYTRVAINRISLSTSKKKQEEPAEEAPAPKRKRSAKAKDAEESAA